MFVLEVLLVLVPKLIRSSLIFLLSPMFFPKYHRKLLRRSRSPKILGFTLIELLVGMVLAFLVMAPMLGFMVNMLESDNSEQAKANTEQEVQAALDYISRDLQQAIYIYGSAAIANGGTLGIRDQIPPAQTTTGCEDNKCEPILAFWRRQLVQDAEKFNQDADKSNDVSPYVYSLVVYYHITGDQGAANSVWSKAARIGRFEIRDGVRKSPPPPLPIGTEKDDPQFYADKTHPIYGVDKGFKLFDLTKTGVKLDQAMNSWEKGSEPYDSPVAVLLDHIDQSEWIKDSQVLNNLQCPPDPSADTPGKRLERIPVDGKKVYGFYSCVNSNLWVAQTFIRGNSMFRVKPNCTADKAECQYSEARRAFFPRATVQVRGQGFLDVL